MAAHADAASRALLLCTCRSGASATAIRLPLLSPRGLSDEHVLCNALGRSALIEEHSASRRRAFTNGDLEGICAGKLAGGCISCAGATNGLNGEAPGRSRGGSNGAGVGATLPSLPVSNCLLPPCTDDNVAEYAITDK